MRKGVVERNTTETRIRAQINLDGTGEYEISTGMGFFDHMLELLSKHSLVDIDLEIDGDLEVDCHHSVEDAGIVLGQAFKQALGNKQSITRYADASIPMDEALTSVSIDISGRPFLVYDVQFTSGATGGFELETIGEFMTAFCQNAGFTMHISLVRGTNNHHIAESVFKAVARALKQAVSLDDRIKGVLSTKGIL
jgi:imidazoleglycerol-phosphate dehydratase